LIAQFCRTSTANIQDHRDVPLVSLSGRDFHRLHKFHGQRPDIQHQRGSEPRHLGRLLLGMRHHGRCPERFDDLRAIIDRYPVR